jgi:glycosyltransferase involved in cell wall biosynthesis
MKIVPTLVYWNNIPSPYMVDRFNRLALRGNVEFAAWFTQRAEAERSWNVDESKWLFPHQYVGTDAVRATACGLRMLRGYRPDVLFCLYEKPEYVAVALAARASRVPVVMHAMRTFDTWRPRSASREIAKRLVFPRVSGFYVPGPDSADYVERYGVPRSRIRIFPEPVDVEAFRHATEESQRRACREQTKCEFLYVGRLWHGKGLDFLFDAYAAVAEQRPEVSLLLVGDGIDEERYRARARSLPHVRFAGFVQVACLPPLYASADVLVFPTLGDPYGHVVQEAMASSLPVISTTAAGDISERVVHGKTGLLVPPADSEALAQAMLKLAGSPVLREAMGTAGLDRIRSRTNDSWAEHIEAFAADLVA